MKPKSVYSLARWFVTECLGQEWDSRKSGMYLKHASMLLNPKVEGQKQYTYDEVIYCLNAIKDGVFGVSGSAGALMFPNSLLFVLYGTPPYIERMKDIKKYLPPVPPIYEKKAYQDWQDKYSKYLKEK